MGARRTSIVHTLEPLGVLHVVGHRATAALRVAMDLAADEDVLELGEDTTLGADVVGMSTVAEVTLARHCGLRTFALAVVVNLAAGLSQNHINHEETLHFTGQAAGKVTTLFNNLLADKSWQKW